MKTATAFLFLLTSFAMAGQNALVQEFKPFQIDTQIDTQSFAENALWEYKGDDLIPCQYRSSQFSKFRMDVEDVPGMGDGKSFALIRVDGANFAPTNRKCQKDFVFISKEWLDAVRLANRTVGKMFHNPDRPEDGKEVVSKTRVFATKDGAEVRVQFGGNTTKWYSLDDIRECCASHTVKDFL